MEFSRQEYWSGLPFPPPGDLSHSGIKPSSSVSLALQEDSLPPSHLGNSRFNPSLVQFSSVTQSCPTLCNPMNCSTPGLSVHHQLPEFTQAHVHWVGDAIQPFHPLSSPSPPASNPSQHQSLFQWVNSLHEVAKVWSFSFSIIPSKEIPGLISFRMDWLDVCYRVKESGYHHSLRVCAVLSHVWLFVTLWTVAHQTPLSIGFSRQEYWNVLPFSPSGDLPDLGIEPGSPVHWQADSLPLSPLGIPPSLIISD